jgi:farnesyl-diphosphate farnesyltransferase
MINTNTLKNKEVNNHQLQADLLEGVSRTFAFTIPELPSELRYTVTNAYLLCRAIDTIEDEPALNFDAKKKFCNWFTEVVEEKKDPKEFSAALSPLLSDVTIPMEHELIKKIDEVVKVTHSFEKQQQIVLLRCINIMSEGMTIFQEIDTTAGLETLEELDKYCYYVAGVVGEMLTDLFYLHLPEELSPKRDKMMELAISFGQGLQMTNILKDIWDDQERGVCWLPKDVFNHYNFDLSTLTKENNNENFKKGLKYLIGVAHTHLMNAFDYTIMIPTKQTGIRNFNLYAIFMAILTLKKINENMDATNSSDWKIQRKSVKKVVIATKLTSKNDRLLKAYFKILRKGLPESTTTFNQ